jgi:N-dimethylarginine dimethylaminohydrolase
MFSSKRAEASMPSPTFLLVDPGAFEVAYAINPWMEPRVWRANPDRLHKAARTGFTKLAASLRAAGAHLEILPPAPGAPDLVFAANSAVVLDGRALLARFRYPQRQVEEPHFRAAFDALKARGVLAEVAAAPAGCVQEGAGDAIWDAGRDLFWAGFGPRSDLEGVAAVAEFFGRETVPLELATSRFYHLDTCFCPLPRGEILYYPPAFTAKALRTIRERVQRRFLIEASNEEASRFCVNAVAFGSNVVMAKATARLRGVMAERGYRLSEVDLAPFILSGGGAYCMTLRLDRASAEAAARMLKEPAQ